MVTLDIPLGIVALVMGVSLGILGTGGAILAVPAMVYLLHIDPIRASAYSYVVLALSTSISVVSNALDRTVHWRSVVAFSATTIPCIILVRSYLLPAIPSTIVLGSYTISRSLLLMVLFGTVLLVSGMAMIRKPLTLKPPITHLGYLSLLGMLIGAVSGILGASGGFMITPALVVWARLDTRHAIGTAVTLIWINSTAGFIGDAMSGGTYVWPFLLSFTAITSAGVLLGVHIGKRMSSDHLRRAFGIVVVILGLFVLYRELLVP